MSITENKTSKIILKATQLNFLKLSSNNLENSTQTSQSTNIFKNNPFAKVVSDEEEKPSEEEKSADTPEKNNDEKTNEKKLDSPATKNSLQTKLSLFSNAGSTTAPNSFVFGQNLHERVVGVRN